MLGLLLSGMSAAVQAQWVVSETPFHDSEPGNIGVGFAWRWGDSPYRDVDELGSVASDYSSDLVPLYLYEGRRLFSHGTQAGVHLVRDQLINFDLLARYRFDRLETDASSFYDGMKDRQQSVDGGFAISLDQPWGLLNFSAVTDLLSRHDGEELDLTYRYPIVAGRWTFTPSVSLVYQSRDLIDYYYGVSSAEARPDRPEYSPDSALFWRAGLNTAYHLTENWHVFANMSYENLDDTVRDSPLTERRNLFSSYVGASYSLGNTLPKSPAGKGIWSYRANFGYTGEATFAKTNTGNLRPHKDADTTMAGLTIGKLFKDGRRADLWGRFSLNRRFENDYQKDFFEYVAYVMAMGTGYSPWTERELFRWGFGFGISYAERVPYTELVDHDGPDERTNHWLNYLETQLDFPLQNLFGKRAPRDCYIGMTIVHRSGIFGSSDVLGNADGGSEVITGHIECKR